jgi:hydrogenase maturation protease
VAERSTQPAEASQGRESKRLLVVGCGNPLAGDDGAGVEIARRLRERGDAACRVRALPSAGVDVLEDLSSADVILFVDAVSSGLPPGTLHLVPLGSPEVAHDALRSLSSHGWGIHETLELARALGRELPQLMLLGVEVGTVALGDHCSPAVERAVGLVLERFPCLQSHLVDAQSPLWRTGRQFLPDADIFPGM